MQFIRPDFYDDFHCLADACRHSCCIGWEIDVDEESLDLYRRVPGDFGARLRRSISTESGWPPLMEIWLAERRVRKAGVLYGSWPWR